MSTNKILHDNLTTEDRLSTALNLAGSQHSKAFRTRINGYEINEKDEFGKILFTNEENETVLSGAITVMEKLWGVRSPLQIATINEIMQINQNITIPANQALTADDTVCLWGVGNGGSGDAFGSVRDVKFYEREVGQNGHPEQMVPFRCTAAPLTGDDVNKYHLITQDKDGLYRAYLKSFEVDPVIKTLWKDGAEGEDGSEVDADVFNTTRTEDIESFVQMNLKISKKDIREFYEATGAIKMSRINTIALFTGKKVEISPGVFDYVNIKLFSKLNIDNEPLNNVKEIGYEYRVYLK